MSSKTTRLTALDYARAWAIFGMIIVNYKLAMEVGDHGAAFPHRHVAWKKGLVGRQPQTEAHDLFIVRGGYI